MCMKICIKAISLALAVLSLACVPLALRPGRVRIQDFEFENDGIGPVDGIKVNYGMVVLPIGIHPPIYPTHRRLGDASIEMPLPRSISIAWVSQDGANHNAIVPLWDLIKGNDDFHGCKFVFIDDQVEVYMLKLVERKFPNGRKYYADINYVKIYSSAAQQTAPKP